MITRRGVLQAAGVTGASVIAARTGAALAATSTVKTAVGFDVPRGACDCHVHVFGDAKQFPFAAERSYTPPEASVQDLRDLQAALRFDRVVIVQPSVYGTDNSCTLDGIRQLGARARGVAVIGPSTSASAIDEMAANGIRGVRLNLETAGQFDPASAKRLLVSVAEQIRRHNWHIQFYTRLSVIAALKDDIAALPFPVVFDHFGGAKAALGTAQPGFDAMLDLVKSGRACVKISGMQKFCHIDSLFEGTQAYVQALLQAFGADACIWGSDWPFLREQTRVDYGPLLKLAEQFMPDAEVRRRLEATGWRIISMSPEETRGFVRGEAEKWPALLRQAGIRPE